MRFDELVGRPLGVSTRPKRLQEPADFPIDVAIQIYVGLHRMVDSANIIHEVQAQHEHFMSRSMGRLSHAGFKFFYRVVA